jgi:hypothetical protein
VYVRFGHTDQQRGGTAYCRVEEKQAVLAEAVEAEGATIALGA